MRYLLLFILPSLLLFTSCSTESTPVYQLTTTAEPSEAGTVSPSSAEAEEGESLQITASANEGWVFDRWGGDHSGTSNPANVTMNSDKSVTALFQVREHPLTINIEGGGSVQEEILQQKTTDYEHGTVVELTAVSDDGWIFSHWSGDADGEENPVILEIDSDKEVTAVFERREYALTIQIEGEGAVSEEVVQAKTTDYPYETIVELSANPATGWAFSHWEGDLSGDENPATIEITEAKEVTAVFEYDYFELTTTVTGEGSISEALISGDQSEDGTYQYGSVVELTAESDQGWTFSDWGGELEGEDNPVQITIGTDNHVEAFFERREYDLTIHVDGEGSVSEEVIQSKSTAYPYETVVQLTASPSEGWAFSHWEGDLSGDENPAEIVVDSEKEITAVFEPQYLELITEIEGQGSVDEILLSGDRNADGNYAYNSVIELTATADNEWHFSRWEGDINSTESTIEVELTTNTSITALFNRDESIELNLSIGETHVEELPGGTLILPSQSDGTYRVGIIARDYQSDGSTLTEVPDGLMLRVTEESQTVAKQPPLAVQRPQTTEYRDDMIHDEIWELMKRTDNVHHKLREKESRKSVDGLRYTPSGEPSRLGTVSRFKMNQQTEPEETRTFYASNPNGSGRIVINATLRKNGTNIIYYQDDTVAGTSEEATDQEIEKLLDYYDNYGKPLIDEMFGGLGPDGTTNHFAGGERAANDIDGNGKFIVLQLHPDNMIGGAAGYVSSCDRYPLEENYNAGQYYCEKSNEAEITYLLRPDSDFYLGTLVHEAKHISSHGYAVFGDRGFQPSWIEEGTAEIAKEMSSRKAAGFTDSQELTFDDIYPGRSTTPETEGMAVTQARARSFLNASPENGLFGNPDGNPNNSTYYGSSWLFHRYLADNYAGGNQNQFFRHLNDGTTVIDIDGLSQITGKSFNELLNGFITAIQIEGHDSAKMGSDISFSSYDFEEIASNFTMGDWPYIYNSSMTSGSAEFELSPIYYSSIVLFEFTNQSGDKLELELLNRHGDHLDALHDAALIITRID